MRGRITIDFEATQTMQIYLGRIRRLLVALDSKALLSASVVGDAQLAEKIGSFKKSWKFSRSDLIESVNGLTTSTSAFLSAAAESDCQYALQIEASAARLLASDHRS